MAQPRLVIDQSSLSKMQYSLALFFINSVSLGVANNFSLNELGLNLSELSEANDTLEYFNITLVDLTTGENITIENNTLDVCFTLNEFWDNRVDGVNTHQNCYQLFNESECLGKSIFIHNGPFDNDLLSHYNFENVVSSYKLCDINENLAEESFKTFFPKPKNLMRPEREFWMFVLGMVSGQLKVEYELRSTSTNHISWDFLPGITNSSNHQYQKAFYWAKNEIKGGNSFGRRAKELRQFILRVATWRAGKCNKFSIDSKGTMVYAVYCTLKSMWEQLAASIL